ncbi:MAG: hypothetical protein HC828_05640 [Blastochloris sp.]|nr:hypothetical protein [Blastochloris sp.]
MVGVKRTQRRNAGAVALGSGLWRWHGWRWDGISGIGRGRRFGVPALGSGAVWKQQIAHRPRLVDARRFCAPTQAGQAQVFASDDGGQRHAMILIGVRRLVVSSVPIDAMTLHALFTPLVSG